MEIANQPTYMYDYAEQNPFFIEQINFELLAKHVIWVDEEDSYLL